MVERACLWVRSSQQGPLILGFAGQSGPPQYPARCVIPSCPRLASGKLHRLFVPRPLATALTFEHPDVLAGADVQHGSDQIVASAALAGF
jgi:hypothetical protein